MNYSTLEDAYGSPFKQRVSVAQTDSKPVTDSYAKPEFSSIEDRAKDSIRKNQSLIDSVKASLPLDQDPKTENFVLPKQPDRIVARERFAESQPAGFYESQEQADKLNRILRLVEQNRTGYERPAIQDIALYVFTGVFFLFTFDTFVELGKSMN